MVTAIKNNIKQLCPRCGKPMINDYGEPYCLFHGSNPRLVVFDPKLKSYNTAFLDRPAPPTLTRQILSPQWSELTTISPILKNIHTDKIRLPGKVKPKKAPQDPGVVEAKPTPKKTLQKIIKPVGNSKKSDKRRSWDPLQDEILRSQYDGTGKSIILLVEKLGKSATAIRGRIQFLKLMKKSNRRWTDEELVYLRANLGILPDEKICRKLNRSKNALHIITVRKLKMCRRDNIYTAHEVARLLGISCSKTIVFWFHKGWITGRRAYFQGLNQVWSFTCDAIEDCLIQRPWLVNIDRMERSYFKELIKQEYSANPWYSLEEANNILGLKSKGPIPRYIKWGFLKADKAPGGPHQYRWIIRKSDLDAFIQSKALEKHRKEIMSMNRRQTLLQRGDQSIWHLSGRLFVRSVKKKCSLKLHLPLK